MDCVTKVTRTDLGLFLDHTPTQKARSTVVARVSARALNNLAALLPPVLI